MSTSTSSNRKVILVTGGNRGLGLSTVEKFAANNTDYTVLLGSRNIKLGVEQKDRLALKGLKNIEVLQIDTSDEQSIINAAATVKSLYGGLDILINNAGVLIPDSESNSARNTINVNYYGVLNGVKYFQPLLKPGAKVVNVSSLVGSFAMAELSVEWQNFFNSESLTEQQLTEEVEKYVKLAEEGKLVSRYGDLGFTFNNYCLSKVFATALTFIQSRNDKQHFYAAVHPGYVATDMNPNAQSFALTPDQGADHILFPLTLSFNQTGKLWYDEKELPTILQVPTEFQSLMFTEEKQKKLQRKQ